MKQLRDEANSDIVVTEAAEWEHKKTIAENIEILAQVIGHAINTFDQDPVNKIPVWTRMSDTCSSAASDCIEAESADAKAVAQRTSFADVDKSKSRLISGLKEHINVNSFPR